MSSRNDDSPHIAARAPGRVCLLGDNADLIERPAIAAAISAFLTVRLVKRTDDRVVLIGRDIGVREEFERGETLRLDTPLKYMKAVYLRLQEDVTSGFEAEVTSEIPVSAGLSSSTALCIAFIRAICQAYAVPMDPLEVAELSFDIESNDLDIECGRMDQYAIASGGVTYIETGDPPGVERIPVASLPIVVGDTREPHDTQQLQKWLRGRIEANDPSLMHPLMRVTQIVEEGRRSLYANDLKELGELMILQQVEERLMGTSTDRLEAFCRASREAGALGAKQMGAGGGGCMIALCPGNERPVKAAIEKLGGTAWAFEVFRDPSDE
jgi:mevalonate kinase